MNPFFPRGDSVKVGATTSSASVALLTSCESIRVLNTLSTVVFVSFGVGSATAAVDGNESIPLAPGATEVFGGGNYTHAAAIATAGSGDVWFTPGAGI